MKNTFSVDEPHIVLTTDFEGCKQSLEALGVKYRQVTKEYFIFPARLFGSDLDLMVGVHGNSGVPRRVVFLEVFRPEEYYKSPEYDLDQSFRELSGVLRRRYGAPRIVTSASINGQPCEQWLTQDYIVNHCLMERLAVYESLHINFYQY